MSRRSQPERFKELVGAATKIFLQTSFRRAQVTDIAREMHVAPGTVYLYVEGKDALFDLVLRTAVDGTLPSAEPRPLPNPEPGATLRFIRKTLTREAKIPALTTALENGPTGAELEDIARELFRVSSRYWLAIKLIERSAADWPELAEAWLVRHRGRIITDLQQYFSRAPGLRRGPHPDVAARLVLEMNAYLAIHRHTDPFPQTIDDRTAEGTFVDAVRASYGAASDNADR